jgi:hypothetical protein
LFLGPFCGSPVIRSHVLLVCPVLEYRCLLSPTTSSCSHSFVMVLFCAEFEAVSIHSNLSSLVVFAT